MDAKRVFTILFIVILLIGVGIGFLINFGNDTIQKNGNDVDNNEFCDDGTPVGKCDREERKFYCNEDEILIEDCTKCYGCESPYYCNLETKICTIDKNDVCPPYEKSCSYEPLTSSCSLNSILKLKGNKNVGVILVSQFNEDQLPKSYINLIKGTLTENEGDWFIEKFREENWDTNLEHYKIDFINEWIKDQAQRILSNKEYVNLNFNFANDVCYLTQEVYDEVSTWQNLKNYVVENCAPESKDNDVILVISLELDGASTTKEQVGGGGHRGGVADTVRLNDGRILGFAWAELTTLPPFCNTNIISVYNNCQFPGGRDPDHCIELTCFNENECYSDINKCIDPTGVTSYLSISTHELLHRFGAGDHHFGMETSVLGFDTCMDLEVSTLPFNIPGCEITSCLMNQLAASTPLTCNLLCGKEAREIGWIDLNNDGKIELER